MNRLVAVALWAFAGLWVATMFHGVSGCASCQYPGTGGRASTGGASPTGGYDSGIGGSSMGPMSNSGGAPGPSGTGGGSPLTNVDKACQNMLGKCPEVKDVAACVATINKINAGKVGNFDPNTLDCLGAAKTQKDVQNCNGPVCGGVN